MDEEKRLATTFAIWPAYVESRLVHEHDVFFLNSMSVVRHMVMRYHDNKLRKKVNRKAERERESASSEKEDGSNAKIKEVRRKEKEPL